MIRTIMILIAYLQTQLCTVTDSYDAITKTLTFSNNYSCVGADKNVFESVQQVVDHMITDHKKSDGQFNTYKPEKVVMDVTLDNTVSACFMDIKIQVFNPFILGTLLDPQYSIDRATADTSTQKYDQYCCLNLPNTQDLQLSIKPSTSTKINIVSRSKKQDYHSQTLFAHFPTVIIENIRFVHEFSISTSRASLDIRGYDFGKNVDGGTISERIVKFKKSYLEFKNVNLNTHIDGQYNINSTFYQIKFKTVDSIYQSKCLTSFINIKMQQDQYKYLYDQEKTKNSAITPNEILVEFYKVDVNIWNQKPIGQLIGLQFQDEASAKAVKDDFMKIKLKIEKSSLKNLVLINQGVSDPLTKAFIWSSIESRMIETQISEFEVSNCTFRIPILMSYNISSFNTITLKDNIFIGVHKPIQTDIVNSSNLALTNNTFKYNSNIITIDLGSSLSALQTTTNRYASRFYNISFDNNTFTYQVQNDEDNQKSLISYQGHSQESTITSADSSKITDYKTKLGLHIIYLRLINNTCPGTYNSISVCEELKITKVNQTFYFSLNNSEFINSTHLNSNKLNSTNYVEIFNATVYSQDTDYTRLAGRYNTDLSQKDVPNSPYFFNITGFTNIQVQKVSVSDTVFKASLFYFSDMQQLQQTKQETNQQSVVNLDQIHLTKGVFITSGSSNGNGLIFMNGIQNNKFTMQNVNFSNLRMYQQSYFGENMAVVLYYKNSYSEVVINNLTAENIVFQYRKGLLNVEAYKLTLENSNFTSNQNYDHEYMVLDSLRSKGTLLEAKTDYLIMDNVQVTGMMGYESAILDMKVNQNNNLLCSKSNSCYINDNVIDIKNSNFTNIVSQTKSMLFNIDLENVAASKLVTFNNISTKNTYSLKDGPIFRFYNVHGTSNVKILNSQFRSFKAGSGEQLLQYFTREQIKYSRNVESKQLVVSEVQYGSQSGSISQRQSTLIIKGCTIDNKGMMNYFVNYLFHIDLGSLKPNQYSDNQQKNKGYFDNLMKYTNGAKNVAFSSFDYQLYTIVDNVNKFKTGVLISVIECKLTIENTVITDINSYQMVITNLFPQVLFADQSSVVKISNTTFRNMNFNQEGLIKVNGSELTVENCMFDSMQHIRRFYIKSTNSNTSSTDIAEIITHKARNYDSLSQYKGGIYSRYSTLVVTGNTFKNMKCWQCTGLVLYIENSRITAKYNTFENNIGSQATCVYMYKGLQDDFQFYNDRSSLSQQGNKHNIKDPEAQFVDNKFINNYALYNSSGIYIERFNKVIITGNTFKSNSAKDGTCIFFKGSRMDVRSLLIVRDNQFDSNKAQRVGQIVYQGAYIYDLQHNQFKDDSAGIHSNKIYSYPSKMKLNLKVLNGKTEFVEGHYTLNDYPPTMSQIPLEFMFYDEKDEQIVLSEQYKDQISFSKIIKVKSIQSIFGDKIKNSIYTMQNAEQVEVNNFNDPNQINVNTTWVNSNLKIKAAPLSQAIVEFSTNIIQKYDTNIFDYKVGATFKLIINFRECRSGEYYNKDNNYCEKCPNGTFSFNINDPCKKYSKVNLMENALGGNETSVKKGAWRSKTNTETIIACKNSDFCEPDKQKYPKAEYSSANFLCRTGHIGALCESCDHYGVFWGISYQFSPKDNQCVSCSESSWTIVFFFLFVIVLGLFVIYTVDKQYKCSQDINIRHKLKTNKNLFICDSHRFMQANQRISANKAYCKSNDELKHQNLYPMKLKYKERNDGFSYDTYVEEGNTTTKKELNVLQVDFNEILQPATLIKILMTYLLIAAITIDIMQDQIKSLDAFKRFFQSTGEPAKQAAYSVECFIISLGFKDTPVYLIKDIIIIITPMFNWLVFLLLQKLIFKSKIDSGILMNSLSFIIYYNYPQVIKSVFPGVVSQNYGEIDYVQSDLKFLYNSPQQQYIRYLFYVPVLLILLVLIPGGAIWFLRKNKKKLYEHDFMIKFGFLYQEYRQECYYIELIKVLLKVIIMMVQSIYQESAYMQVSVIQQILTVYLLIIIRSRPYEQHSANAIELYNIILSLFNMILVNAIYQGFQSNYFFSAIIFMITLVTLNLLFIAIFMIFFFKQQVTFINEILIQVKSTIVTKIPKLKKIKSFRKLVSGYKMNYKDYWKRALKTIKHNNFQLFTEQQQKERAVIKQKRSTSFQNSDNELLSNSDLKDSIVLAEQTPNKGAQSQGGVTLINKAQNTKSSDKLDFQGRQSYTSIFRSKVTPQELVDDLVGVMNPDQSKRLDSRSDNQNELIKQKTIFDNLEDKQDSKQGI